MQSGLTLTVFLFGAFRLYGNDEPITLHVPPGTTAAAAKPHLKAALKQIRPDFDQEALVDASVFADDTQVFPEDAVLTANAVLAVLPPVCGG